MTATPTDRSRWVALVVLCAGMLMIILDQTIVNVALPTIQSDLGFSQSSLAWVVNAYLIALGGLLLLAGRMGDLLGRKRVFLAGLTLFTLASLLCGASQTEAMLIAARFVQGIGAAMTSAVILGMIVTMFPQPRERATAIGIYSFVASAGASVGLLAGGVITQAVNWHWIFFVNLPIGLAAAVLAVRLLEPDRGIGLGEGADVAGAALVTGALMLGVYTIVGTVDHGWVSAHTLGFGAAAAVLLAGFVARQATASRPLVPLRIFRSRNVSGANVVQALMVAGMFGMFFLGTLYLQRVLGYDAVQTGAAFLPVSVGIGTLSLGFSARLITRLGARAVLLPGLVALVAGLVLLTGAPVGGDYVTDLLPALVLLGVGRRASPSRRSSRWRCRVPRPRTRGWPRVSSTRPSRSAVRWASPSSPRCRPRARTTCWPTARARRRRSPGATTWPSPSGRAWWSPRSWSRRSSCAPSGVALQEAPAVETATEELAYREAA